MRNNRITVTVLLTALAVVFACGCTKPDEPNNGGGGGNNGGNSGGGHYNGNYEFVDLGLPSGTLWATFNLGAAKPEDVGDRFAWGETEPKDKYSKDTYKHGNGRYEGFKLTKYCNDPSIGENGYTDTLTVLQPEDDAATVKWGDGWCMPTAAQYQELKDNTTRIYEYGTKGVLLKASNGKTLFFPAQRYSFDANGRSFGLHGIYFSNLTRGDKFSYTLHLEYEQRDDGQVQNGIVFDLFSVDTQERYEGFLVRPVRAN